MEMHYTAQVPFTGDTAKALDLAAAALTGIGFRMIARDETTLEMAGPPMTSTKQSPLVGSSHILAHRAASELSVEAELGGVQRMSRFVTFFPIGLCLLLCVVFYIVFGLIFEDGAWEIPVLAVTGGNALLWLLLAPIISRHIRARTCRGIDSLLENMTVAGRNQEPS